MVSQYGETIAAIKPGIEVLKAIECDGYLAELKKEANKEINKQGQMLKVFNLSPPFPLENILKVYESALLRGLKQSSESARAKANIVLSSIAKLTKISASTLEKFYWDDKLDDFLFKYHGLRQKYNEHFSKLNATNETIERLAKAPFPEEFIKQFDEESFSNELMKNKFLKKYLTKSLAENLSRESQQALKIELGEKLLNEKEQLEKKVYEIPKYNPQTSRYALSVPLFVDHVVVKDKETNKYMGLQPDYDVIEGKLNWVTYFKKKPVQLPQDLESELIAFISDYKSSFKLPNRLFEARVKMPELLPDLEAYKTGVQILKKHGVAGLKQSFEATFNQLGEPVSKAQKLQSQILPWQDFETLLVYLTALKVRKKSKMLIEKYNEFTYDHNADERKLDMSAEDTKALEVIGKHKNYFY